MSDLPAFSRPVEIGGIGTGGLVEKIEATERERTDLATELGLVGIGALSAELALTRDKSVIRLDGRFAADIVQNCVVSLVPVAQKIDEPISLRLVQASARAPAPAKPSVEIRVDPGADDPPEVLTESAIDLGAIVVEHLILAIDPYPRAPGAIPPENPAEAVPEASDSPFAVLAGLARPGSKDR